MACRKIPSKSCFWGQLREILGISKGLTKRNGVGGGCKTCRGEGGSETVFCLGLGSCGPGKLNEKGKFPKVLRGGCKGLLDPRSKGLRKVFCTTPNCSCTGAKAVCTGARGLVLPGSKTKNLLHPPLSTFGNFPRPGACQAWGLLMRFCPPPLFALPLVRKSVMPIKSPPAILGAEMAAPILWAPGIFWFFSAGKPPCP